MTGHTSNTGMVTKLLFRLLPFQIMLSAVGAVNGIVSSFFARNYVGIRIVYGMGKDIQYQNIPGLNVLTIRIKGSCRNQYEN